MSTLLDKVTALENEAKSLIHQQSLLEWENWVFGREISLAETYRGHERLFTRESIAEVEAVLEKVGDPDRQKALRYFRNHLLNEYLEKETAALHDEIDNLEARAMIRINGFVVPFRQAPVLQANEENPEKRQLISDACLPVIAALNPLLDRREQLVQRLAKELGFDSYVALSEELRLVDLSRLDLLSWQILSETEACYRPLLTEMTERIVGIPLERFRRADLSRLFKAANFERHFPREKLLSTLRDFLLGLNIDLHNQRNLLIHDDDLPQKSPRAVCFTMEVPDDIRVCVKPIGGPSDYESLLHEMGHAEHYAKTTTRVFAFQHLGNYTVTESFAFLFEDMLENHAWLDRHTTMRAEEIDDFLRLKRFEKLYFLRRYAAKIIYELAFHRGLPNPKEVYRRTLERAYGFPLDEKDAERYLVDMDEEFYSADYFRAWLLEALLLESLERQFGGEWFRKREAG